MSFLNNLVNEFTHSERQEEYPNQRSSNERNYSSNPPQVPPPWIAEWDSRENRYIYYNEETGQRTFEVPRPQYHGGAGYSQQQYGSSYGGQQQRGDNYSGQEQGGEFYEQQPQKPDHSRRNMALAGVAGLAGGALLMHEGEEVSTYLSPCTVNPRA